MSYTLITQVIGKFFVVTIVRNNMETKQLKNKYITD